MAHGDLWSSEQLSRLVHRLRAETEATGEPNPARLADALDELLARTTAAAVAPRTAREVEAIVFPRVWKVMEAARGGLPQGEVRTRITALARRLAARLDEEEAR